MRPRIRASALRLKEPGEIDPLFRLLPVHLHELERAGMGVEAVGAGKGRVAAVQGPELLADPAVVEASMQGDDGAVLALAERGREIDLLAGGSAGLLE